MSSAQAVAAVAAASGIKRLLEMDQSFLEAIPSALYICSADGRIVRFNRRATELWGRTPRPGDTDERFCGAFRLYHLDGTPIAKSSTPMEAALRTGEPQRGLHLVVEQPNGSKIGVLANIDPLKDRHGKVEGAINCFEAFDAQTRSSAELVRDQQEIDQRRRVEEDSFRLASIVESSDDAIASKDLDGIITSWNRGAERLFGYASEEVVGRPVTILIPSDHIDEEPSILARIRRGERIDHYETVRRRKDGSLIDISLTVSPIKDRDGTVIGASKIARNITERKRSELALAKHLDELAALYELTDRLHRARSLDEVYEAALDAIQRALPCRRASILLLDDSGVMRFAAWRGLSNDYRKAVEGHSPWATDERDPQPVFIGDVERAELSDALRATVKREGIGALAFIPLVTGGKLVGKFMTYYNGPHAFSNGESELALAIARQLGFGVERLRAQDDLHQKEERERARAAELQAIMEAVPAVIWIAREPESHRIIGNRLAHEVLRMPHQANLSLSAPEPERPSHFQVFVDDRPLAPDELPVQRAARGEEVHGFEEEVRFDDGTSLYLLGNATPLRDAAGQPTGAVAAFVDITGRKKAEQQRDLLVAELSHRVKNTLATVISIARQSFSRSTDIDEAQRTFDSRIRALAQTHSRLAETNWSGVSLRTMLLDEFAPYGREDGANIRVSGPPVALNARCAVTLGMAMHELVTNAAKYGALSTKDGVVDVTWETEAGEKALLIRWSESGGPAVSVPKSSGFGRLLLERALASDLSGKVQMDFARDGLQCAISLPLHECTTQMT